MKRSEIEILFVKKWNRNIRLKKINPEIELEED